MAMVHLARITAYGSNTRVRREIAIALAMHNSRVVGYPEVIVNTPTANELAKCNLAPCLALTRVDTLSTI
jgi:hypothetical protein